MRFNPFFLVWMVTAITPLALAQEPQGSPPPRRHPQQPERAQAAAVRPVAPRVLPPAATQPRNYGAQPRSGVNSPRAFGHNGENNGYRQATPRFPVDGRAPANPTAEQPDRLSSDLPQSLLPTGRSPEGRTGELNGWRRRGGGARNGSTGTITPSAPAGRNGQQPTVSLGGNDGRNRGGGDGRRRDGDWRDRNGDGGVRNGGGLSYADACRRYRHDRHDRDWWRSHYDRVVLISGGYYYWDTGYWYPAWGYDSAYSSYAYDGPIYGYDGLPPDEVISSVQSALQEEGYYFGAVDGELGPLTRQALAAWQRDHGLAITTVVDEPTMQSLGLR